MEADEILAHEILVQEQQEEVKAEVLTKTAEQLSGQVLTLKNRLVRLLSEADTQTK